MQPMGNANVQEAQQLVQSTSHRGRYRNSCIRRFYEDRYESKEKAFEPTTKQDVKVVNSIDKSKLRVRLQPIFTRKKIVSL
jgi:hypothetical protein